MSKIVTNTIETSTGGPVTLSKQEAVKCFCHFDQSAATNLAVNTSASVLVNTLNTSSLTDTGAGQGTIDWTNVMSSATYTGTTGTGSVAAAATPYTVTVNDHNSFVARTTSSWSFVTAYVNAASNVAFDSTHSVVAIYGDLA